MIWHCNIIVDNIIWYNIVQVGGDHDRSRRWSEAMLCCWTTPVYLPAFWSHSKQDTQLFVSGYLFVTHCTVWRPQLSLKALSEVVTANEQGLECPIPSWCLFFAPERAWTSPRSGETRRAQEINRLRLTFSPEVPCSLVNPWGPRQESQSGGTTCLALLAWYRLSSIVANNVTSVD